MKQLLWVQLERLQELTSTQHRVDEGFRTIRFSAIAEVSSGANVNKGDKADIWNWAVTLAFPDLGKKGNLGGLIFGQPPKVTNNDFGPAVLTLTSNLREDSDTSFHLEGLYRYQVNNNISITPGLIVIFNPEQNSKNDTIYTGVFRTTFRF